MTTVTVIIQRCQSHGFSIVKQEREVKMQKEKCCLLFMEGRWVCVLSPLLGTPSSGLVTHWLSQLKFRLETEHSEGAGRPMGGSNPQPSLC